MTLDIRVTAIEARLQKLLARLPEDVPIVASRDPRLILCEQIMVAAAHYNGTTLDALKNKQRGPNWIAEVRHIAWLLILRHTDFGVDRIAQMYGRDHGAVSMGIRQVEERLKISRHMRTQIETLERELNLNTGTQPTSPND